MKNLFLVFLTGVSGITLAQGFTPPPVDPAEEALLMEKMEEQEVKVMEVSPELGVQLGSDIRLQSTVNPELMEISPSFALGFLVKFEGWALLEEVQYAADESSSGLFSINSQTLEWNNWGQYYFSLPTIYKPFIGAAFGISQNFIETSLAGVTRRDRSRLFYNLGLSAGMGFELSRKIMALVELRGWKFEQKKDPIASGLFSLRVEI